ATSAPALYTLSLHDALPICQQRSKLRRGALESLLEAFCRLIPKMEHPHGVLSLFRGDRHGVQSVGIGGQSQFLEALQDVLLPAAPVMEIGLGFGFCF